MIEVLTCYCPRCQKDYQVAESSGLKTVPWEKPLMPRCIWLPSPQLRKRASSGFDSSPELGQIHKQEFKSKLTFHTSMKTTMGFRSKRDFNFPSPANLVKKSKAAKIHLRFLELGHKSLLSETLWWVHAWFATSWTRRMHKSVHGDDPLTLLVAPQQAKMLPVAFPCFVLMRTRADSFPGHSGCSSNVTSGLLQ